MTLDQAEIARGGVLRFVTDPGALPVAPTWYNPVPPSPSGAGSTPTHPQGTVSTSSPPSPEQILLIAGSLAIILYIVAGIRRLPVGSQAVVVTMGRRTGEIRGEGTTWIAPFFQRLIAVFVRGRQIDIPRVDYFTSDRARITFKTTLRVSVADPAALVNQGEATYAPFQREGATEEANPALRVLVQSCIREVVASMTIHDVAFGAAGGAALGQRILRGVAATSSGWGLSITDVFVTDVDAESADIRHAAEAELREEFLGAGAIAAQKAEVGRAAVFVETAHQIGLRIQQLTGTSIHPDRILQFLVARYQSEQAMQVARSAAGHDSPLGLFYQAQFGAPMPHPSSGLDLSGAAVRAGPRPALTGGVGPWIVGREAQIRIDGEGVGRQHIQVRLDGGRYTIMDLGSVNGTFVGGQRLQANVPVGVTADEPILLGRHVRVTIAQLLG